MEHKESSMRNSLPADNLVLFELLLKGRWQLILSKAIINDWYYYLVSLVIITNRIIRYFTVIIMRNYLWLMINDKKIIIDNKIGFYRILSYLVISYYVLMFKCSF